MTARESHVVELVSVDGVALGELTVEEAHQAPGRLHRAFSVFLCDATGRVLLQQRAAIKTRFPLRWANSCCGHPAPGENVVAAAGRRLAEELGIADVPLTEVGRYTYRAEDPATGRVEHEYDHVLLGDVPPGWQPLPDPEEVAAINWVTVPSLLAMLADDPARHAPWLSGVTARLVEHLTARPALPGVDATPPGVDAAPLGVDATPPGVDATSRGVDATSRGATASDKAPEWSGKAPEWSGGR